MALPVICQECGHLTSFHVGTRPPLQCTWIAGSHPDSPPCACSGSLVHLSGREAEVLILVARGFTTGDAARELGIAPKTVACHRYAFMRKLGLHNSVQVMLWALKTGIIRPDEINSTQPTIQFETGSVTAPACVTDVLQGVTNVTGTDITKSISSGPDPY